ncbi:putative protein C23C11,06c [Talaromyces islandicus]|uniref:Biotin-protein ligase N-terminal domain-containing protein n=1 Tax=Talaromyces islandicus TaxID=28573 RepID=A0A0U1LSU3_TALIS|nr:putative protein C23C11,06c [Talaromyces islandicus]
MRSSILSFLVFGTVMAARDSHSSPKALIYRGPAACDGCPESVAALLQSSSSNFEVEYAGPNEEIDINAESLSDVDLFVQPGGGDLKPGWKHTKKYKNAIREYVAQGGRYAGFCLGAYLAGPHLGYDLLPPGSFIADEMDQDGAQVKNATNTVIQVNWTFHTGAKKGEKEDGRWLYFQDGAVMKLAPSVLNDSSTTILGRFSANNDIAASVTSFEKGWVGLVGPHPEADESWYQLVNVTNPDGIHFDIGHDFVESIMAQGEDHMVSVWGSKGRKNDQARVEEGDRPPDQREDSSVAQDSREPDERTRLLPPNTSNDNYLSPDDPAVSPYNLWSVRALRFFSTVFLAISFIWWVLLLVSIFVSPPGMHNRGSGFTDFSYTTLTVGNLIIGLLFFAIPSQPMLVWNSVLAVLLVADMVLVLAAPRLRLEEGWVGIASVVWAAFIALYNIVQVYFVEKGRKEEEVRLTGRVETRRTLLQWLAVLAETVVLGVVAIVAILLTAILVLRARDSSLQAPGRKYLVNNEKYEVHLACIGDVNANNSAKQPPTILVEAGEDPSEHGLQPFVHNAYANGTIPRYCYWDRPGIAWSDNAPSPHSAGMSADVLSEVLALAGEEGPWIIVTAGVGSIYSRIFASRHRDEVAGLLLIDPTHEDRLDSDIGNPGRGFALWGRGIVSPLGLDRLAGALFKGRTREDRMFGKVAYQGGRFIKAKLQENLVAGSITASEIASAKNIQTPETPLVVVSSGVEVGRSQSWARQQESLTGITDNLLSWDVVKGAPHEVWRTFEGRIVLEKSLKKLVKQ